MDLKELKHTCGSFKSISLEEMDCVKFMRRVDTKFVLSEDQFWDLFPKLSEEYRILEVNNHRVSEYDSMYFDSPSFHFYKDHHRKKLNRMKIRIRKYKSNQLSFLEVKKKVKGRTYKSRIKSDTWNSELTERDKEFLSDYYREYNDLVPSLTNNFVRVTLVNKNMTERLTIDFNVNYRVGSAKLGIPNLVICELKQQNLNRYSPFYSRMKNKQIRPLRISKYCLGIMKLYSEDQVRSNRFKERTLKLNKIIC